eukprot:CAMPEP_0175053094 /NCGR_PEP_ID=MMETSP0052_2-20121109/8727_1 /TAXON_ID=51329 ORGANISM="Polytomella parva, Strain SAG 63-3" /NCGR_SAMPLE_ID=MMETSP0052_2 /ASSEMBLY_ACC=CAM_ASM_000194 /LENGTH=842 /DNA_ID=CAMNT_0016317577 /DNA_START=255 /DNA_END=2783 /DNA_ORIENTATION=-
MLRHPNILTFKDTFETTDKGAIIIYLITEPVKPLLLILDELHMEGGERSEYISLGLLQVTKAISFLNNDCKLIHGNICAATVAVTDTLDWKLHCFDLLSEHALPYDSALRIGAPTIGNQYKPGEYGRGEWDAVQASPPWAIDAWGLGCLINESFLGSPLPAVERLRDTSALPPAIIPDYQRLLSSAPARRQNPLRLTTEGPLLLNRLVDTLSFLENIAVKDFTDKESFFRKLPQVLPSIPQEVVLRKLLPLLAAAMEFGGAPAAAVSGLLQIGSRIQDEAEFNRRIVPSLAKLFASPDRLLRRALLEQVDGFIPRLTPAAAEELIYPHLQTGFSDSQSYIREMTLKAIAPLAPKLSSKTLVQSVLKHLNKTQTDEEPSIRANTTVLLGCLAPSLGESTCKRVLLNAFSRALRDPFPPTRSAGLKALLATKTTYSADDVALRMLPTVLPLCVDPVGEVRAAAISCTDSFMEALRKEHDRRTQQEAAAGGGGGDGVVGRGGEFGSGSSVSNSNSNSNSNNSNNSNNNNNNNNGISFGSSATAGMNLASAAMLNWAVNSLIGVATSTSTNYATAPSTTGLESASMNARSNGNFQGTGSSALSSSSSISSSAPPSKPLVSSSSNASPSFPPAGTSAKASGPRDGWDDDNDDDFLDQDLKEEEEARLRLKSLSSSARVDSRSNGKKEGSMGGEFAEKKSGGIQGGSNMSSSQNVSHTNSSSSTALPSSSGGSKASFSTSTSSSSYHVAPPSMPASSSSSSSSSLFGSDSLDAELAKAEAMNPGSTTKTRPTSALAGVRRGVGSMKVGGGGVGGEKKAGVMKLGASKLGAVQNSVLGQSGSTSLDEDW